MVAERLMSASRRFAVRLHAPELDRRLAAGEYDDRDRRLAERARMLAGPDTRETLARALREIVNAAEDPPARTPTPPNRVPLARTEVSAAADELRRLASRLQSPGPVEPRGVAETRLLLTDGRGPLYNPRSPRPLEAATIAALRDLAPGRPAPAQRLC